MQFSLTNTAAPASCTDYVMCVNNSNILRSISI